MKSNNKMVIIVIILALISFMSLTLFVSYSYVMRSKSSVNIYNITTGNLEATITYNAVTNLSLEMLSDEAGIAQENHGELTISKNNNYSVFYTINVGYVTDNLPDGKTSENLLPLEYVKVALFSMDGNTVSSTPIAGPVRVADLPLASANNLTPYNALYTLGFSTFNTGSQSAKYAIKAWIDSGLPGDYEDVIVYLGASINQETLASKSRYNISGVVKDASNNPLSGAEVSLQNGIIKATTSASGAYTLSNVPVGTWNLSVNYNNETYDTTIHIENGSAISLNAIGPNSGEVGSYLQESAYTYYTTPYKILKSSNLNASTNNQINSSFTIPKAYKLIGEDSLNTLNIANIEIKLDSNNALILSIAS